MFKPEFPTITYKYDEKVSNLILYSVPKSNKILNELIENTCSNQVILNYSYIPKYDVLSFQRMFMGTVKNIVNNFDGKIGLKDFSDILGMANLINNVNTDNVDETIGSNGLYNVFRKDVIKQNNNRENLLSNAPSQDDGMFRIPKVIN